jgi:hypothetical protein
LNQHQNFITKFSTKLMSLTSKNPAWLESNVPFMLVMFVSKDTSDSNTRL